MADSEEKKDEGEKKEPEKQPSGHPFLNLLFIVLLGGAGYYLYSHYRLEREDGRVVVSWKGDEQSSGGVPVQAASHTRSAVDKAYIRIATLNLAPPSEREMPGAYPVDSIALAIREFDLTAIQGIRCDTQRFLLDLVEVMNKDGAGFSFAVDPDVPKGAVRRYNAFVYNTRTVETDIRNLFTVDFEKGGFRYRPLVGHFRVRGPSPTQAFTFCLINATIPMGRFEDNRFPVREARRGVGEMDRMRTVVERVEKYLPQEDDVVIVGGLDMHPWYEIQASGLDEGEILDGDTKIAGTRGVPGLDRLLNLSTARSISAGNFFLRRKATVEYSGRADIAEFSWGTENVKSREFAWAEFYSREGAPRVAAGDGHSW